jgi:hypothetical protein
MLRNQNSFRRFSFSNVTAGLALFVALGGTAAAAVTLDRDSVGSAQIRADAVRSPEIRSDAIRSPEILAGAVRSSEIRDGGVNVADISAGAQTALRGQVRAAADDNAGNAPLPRCTSELPDCPDQLILPLGSGAGARTAPQTPTQIPAGSPAGAPGQNWLVQAKLEVGINNGPGFQGAECGLVNTRASGPAAVLDRAAFLVQPEESAIEQVTLSAVVKKRAGNPTLALRCSSPGDEVIAANAKITALETGTITGP